MNKEQFDKLRDYTIKLFTFVKDDQSPIESGDLFDKTVFIINSYTHYFDLYIMELKKYKELSVERDRVYGRLYDEFRFNSNKALKSKTEIDPYINSDNVYYTLSLSMIEQEAQVKYLEGILSNINQMSYNVKNLIDLKNMKEGNK